MSHYEGVKFDTDIIINALKFADAVPDAYVPSSDGVSAFKFPENAGMRFKVRSGE